MMKNKNNTDRNTRNKKFIKNQRREQTQNKSEQIKQDYIKNIYTINTKMKKNAYTSKYFKTF